MSGNGNGHYWSKFTWRDWQSDRGLRACSLAARGFWLECLAAMHEGEPVGHLTVNGVAATTKQLAVNAQCSEREVVKLLAELEAAGVFSRTTDGIIYSRRMVRDAALSEQGREHARKRDYHAKSTHPPNGGPNGSANGYANGYPSGDPTSPPNGPESESQKRESKQESSSSNLLSLEKKRARELKTEAKPEPERVKPVRDMSLADALVEAGEAQRVADVEIPGPVGEMVKRVASACKMRSPYRKTETAAVQIARLRAGEGAQPEVAVDELDGRPVAPMAAPMQLQGFDSDSDAQANAQKQLAALAFTPEQIARSQRAMAARGLPAPHAQAVPIRRVLEAVA
jgi:hypothetical protein